MSGASSVGEKPSCAMAHALFMGNLAAAIPVGRLGRPEDVANSVLFFAARESEFITGQVLYVCGGTSVGTPVI